MRKLVFLLFSVFLMYRTGAAEPSSSNLTILDRNTWSFSMQETEALNRLGVEVLGEKLMSILKDATGYITDGKLVEFQAIDLNDDGITEMVARIDYSGRGLIRDVTILSRRSGQYYHETIPAYGTTITLLREKKLNLVVGSSPLFELTRVDPVCTFPMLYSWTGSRCKDVSREHRAYYQAQYVPALTNALSRSHVMNLPDKGESKRRVMVEVIGWALATEKLTTMFPDRLVSTNEVTKLSKLMERFDVDAEQDAVLVGKFREAYNHLRRCLRQR